MPSQIYQTSVLNSAQNFHVQTLSELCANIGQGIASMSNTPNEPSGNQSIHENLSHLSNATRSQHPESVDLPHKNSPHSGTTRSSVSSNKKKDP